MRGNFKLNNVWYKSHGGLPQQSLANQMANKVGQGTSDYTDLTTWSAWIQEDWQDGVGKIKPNRNGGFLYGEVDSRVPGQMILPQRMEIINVNSDGSGTGSNYGNFQPEDTAYDITVGTGGYAKAAVRTTLYDAIGHKDVIYFYFYASIPPGVQVTIDIMTTGGTPNFMPTTVVSSTTYTPPEDNYGWYWHGKALDSSAVASTDTMVVAVYPTSGSNSFEWAVGHNGSTLAGLTYSGSAWSNMPLVGGFMDSPFFLTSYYSLSGSVSMTATGSGFFRFNNKLYAYANNKVFQYSSSFPYWDTPGLATAITGITAVTGATVFDDLVYFGNSGGDGDYTVMDTSEVAADTGVNGTLFTKWKGRLWRANSNYVEYSNDGIIWEPTATLGDPIYVTDESDSVTGMCGMGNIMYVATTAGIVPVFEGDIITGGVPWGSLHPQNGTRMVNFEGALYITVNGRVIRYTEDGSMQDVWMSREEDVITGRIGRVWDLERMNNWLLAFVSGDDTEDKPTIWAYQNNSWHHLATLPPTSSSQAGLVSDYDLFYDRTTQRLWAITPDQITYSWYVPDYAINPYNDPDSTYMRTAWVEWDWFDSMVLESQKDYESITIMGENLSSTCYVEVYWKDDASTGWELLGTVNSNNEELIWDDPLTRPDTKRLKLGLLLVTNDGSETPRIRAVRVKYHLMVRDWFRWSLAIDVSGRTGNTQQMIDGVNTLTASQIKDNLDALGAGRVPPFIYQDVDGTEYMVKINDANFTYTKQERIEHTSTAWWEGVYRMVLEQVRPGEYTAP